MLSLADVRDWLKTLMPVENGYIGKLDNKKEKSIGVYQRQENGPVKISIGGLNSTRHDVKRISVLVHWNKNARETELVSFELFEKLREITNIEIGQTHIDYLMLLVPEPQEIGTDDNGVYERVIWFDLILRKER